MAGWAMVLYGSNTDESDNFPAVTTITGHSDDVSWSFTAKGVEPSYDYEGEEIKYLGGMAESKSRLRLKMNIKTKYFAFPSSATTTESYYPVSVLAKKYHWIDLGTYPLKPSSYSSGDCMAIAIQSIKVEHNYEQGMKAIELEVIARSYE